MIDTLTLEKIARRLCDGRPVFVRRQAPSRAGASGQVCHDSAGNWYIDIDPDLTGAKLSYVFLHECAHLTLNHITAPSDKDAHPVKAGAIPPPALNRVQQYTYDRLEREADEQAAAWQAWIDAHGGALASLLDWWPPEYEQAIEAGVSKAYQKLGLRRVNR